MNLAFVFMICLCQRKRRKDRIDKTPCFYGFAKTNENAVNSRIFTKKQRGELLFLFPRGCGIINHSTNLITACNPGTANIIIKHKVTNITKTFLVVIDRYELVVGLSTDDYKAGCRYGSRNSKLYGETFFYALNPEYNNTYTSYLFNWNDELFHGASKNDFRNNSSASGVIADNVDFMVYIGHGIAADRNEGWTDQNLNDPNKGNFLHYNFTPLGNSHSGSFWCYDHGVFPCHCNCYGNDDYNLYTSEVKFGSSTSKLRWVWLYSCNFLTNNSYVTDTSLKNMMNGAHIVMGYASQSYLCTQVATRFAVELSSHKSIISSFFIAGDQAEASQTSDDHIQKVLYIDEAYDETIDDAPIHYSYNSSDVKIITNHIQDNIVWS